MCLDDNTLKNFNGYKEILITKKLNTDVVTFLEVIIINFCLKKN